MYTDADHKDKSTLSGSYSKPQFDPTAVLTLATFVPNCSRVTPPKDERPLTPLRLSTAVHHHLTAGCTTSESVSLYFSVGESASYFSSLQRRQGRGEAHRYE